MSPRGRPRRPAPEGERRAAARDERTARDDRAARDERAADLSAPELLAFYRPDLAGVLAASAVPAYRYEQALQHLFRRPLLPFAESTVLPGPLRQELDALGASSLAVAGSRTAEDGTTKLVLAAQDGAQIEMVIMRYRKRVTACISSQVGCPVGCIFCATGRGGLERNLSATEIVDQVRAAEALLNEEGSRVSNVVYMGMGEPLLNLRAVLDSIRVLTSPRALGLGHRSLSISTVGIPTGIRRLAHAEPQVNLALSLHAADDRTRSLLIPQQFRHPLSAVLSAAWEHFDLTRRKLLVEYVLLADVNDSPADARRLAGLLRGHVVAVNLLAWNPVPDPAAAHRLSGVVPDRATGTRRSGAAGPPADRALPDRRRFRPSSREAVAAFRRELTSAGIEAVVRQSKGAGIDAACGQLARRARGGPGHRSRRPG